MRSVTSRTRIVAAAQAQNEARRTNASSWFNALRFTSPAPERINGRLAMAMFGPMVIREMNESDTIVQQLSMHHGVDWRAALACVVIVYASMVPFSKSCKDEDFGIFSVRAEKVNGRLAMLAWAAVIALEAWVGKGMVCFSNAYVVVVYKQY